MKKIYKACMGTVMTLLFTALALTGCSGKSAVDADSPKTQTISLETQAIDLDGVQNARQLGGYICADGRKIKDGVLLRSGALNNLTDEGAETLSEQYHLKYIFDFRMDSEREASPDKEVPGAENLSLPVFKSPLYDEDTMAEMKDIMKSGDREQSLVVIAKHKGMSSIYKNMLLTEEGQSAYAQFFDTLLKLEDGEAVLWHCSQGKDRAGMAAVLLLYALGADEETIRQDYLLTNDSYKDMIAESEEKAKELGLDEEETREYTGTAASVNADFLKLAIDSVKAEYGSVQDYLKNQLDVSDEELQNLRDIFLEK